MKPNLSTKKIPTWCPGCYNFHILAGVKSVLEEEISKEKKKFAIAAGIGCHARIFDYIDLPGIHTIHGRVIPACVGMKLGNPNLEIIGFAGDGDAYSEGMGHLIHSCKNNPNINYIVHNNQVLALTVGQQTPVSDKSLKSKSNPEGIKTKPLNPIAIVLASGASFVARVFAEKKQIEFALKEALKHKGFSFIEILQPCLIFNKKIEHYKEKIYSLEEEKHDKKNFMKAMEKAMEFDYDVINEKTRIPTGIFYQAEKPVFEEQFWQIQNLKKKKIGWKDIRR